MKAHGIEEWSNLGSPVRKVFLNKLPKKSLTEKPTFVDYRTASGLDADWNL